MSTETEEDIFIVVVSVVFLYYVIESSNLKKKAQVDTQ